MKNQNLFLILCNIQVINLHTKEKSKILVRLNDFMSHLVKFQDNMGHGFGFDKVMLVELCVHGAQGKVTFCHTPS